MLRGDGHHMVGVFTHPQGCSRAWLLPLLSVQADSADPFSSLPGLPAAASAACVRIWEARVVLRPFLPACLNRNLDQGPPLAASSPPCPPQNTNVHEDSYVH